jgi:hypothetical protein
MCSADLQNCTNLKKTEQMELDIEIFDKDGKALHISGVSGSSIPKPPEPPLCRVMREGVGHFCINCGSTMPRSGFLMLFGKRYCDNDKCPNSKPLKNYR